jgi:DNA-binding NarL/FixJ family response regulator
MTAIAALVVDDHRGIGKAGDADDLLRTVAAHEPDVGVVDVRMRPTYLRSG